jgi:hypothetical protein
MAGRIVTGFQRAVTTTVNDIEHVEANSYTGVGIIKVFFQPNVDIRLANAQVTASPEIALNVPASALIFDQDGLKVATVDGANRVVLKAVTIARDLGRTVEIGSGLMADDRVIESPQDGVATGDEVRIAGSPKRGGAAETMAKQ